MKKLADIFIELEATPKFKKVMKEFGQGKLISHGEKVTDPKQAVAIAASVSGQSKPKKKYKKKSE